MSSEQFVALLRSGTPNVGLLPATPCGCGGLPVWEPPHHRPGGGGFVFRIYTPGASWVISSRRQAPPSMS